MSQRARTVLGVDLLTLGIAVFGAVTGAASLAWAIASHILSGGRVKVELLAGWASAGDLFTGPLTKDTIRPDPADDFEPMLAVRASNTGRLPVSVEGWSVGIGDARLGHVPHPASTHPSPSSWASASRRRGSFLFNRSWPTLRGSPTAKAATRKCSAVTSPSALARHAPPPLWRWESSSCPTSSARVAGLGRLTSQRRIAGIVCRVSSLRLAFARMLTDTPRGFVLAYAKRARCAR